MNKAFGGLVILLGALCLALIWNNSTSKLAAEAQKAEERPEGLKQLNRPAVRDACAQHPLWSMEICRTMDSNGVTVGMTYEQLLLSKGKPQHVNTTLSGNHEREQWVYANKEYVYLDNGIVAATQDSM